tara:strand:+ start:238 stop:678 length:441 start_codon:yes stop_codon:yes gene_type:complete
MKITRRQLRKLIKESTVGSAFNFMFDPLDYINSDLSYEELRQMIEVVLDAHSVDYDVNNFYDAVQYSFGFEPDNPLNQRNYEAFHAILNVLMQAGIPTSKLANKNKREFYSIPRYFAIDSNEQSAELYNPDGGIIQLEKPQLIKNI